MPDDKRPKGEFDIGVNYEVIMNIENHLKREHNLTDGCEIMKTLHDLWGEGVDNAVARNPDHPNDVYMTYKKVIVQKRAPKNR